MKTKALLFTLFAVTLFAFGTTVSVIFNTAPTSRDVIWLFYGSYFITVFGIIFFLLFGWNYLKFRSTPPWLSTLTSFRYAAVISLLTTLLILMNAHNVLTLPVGIVIAVGLMIAELVWRRRTQTR